MLPGKLCGGGSLDELHSSDAAPCFQLLFSHHCGQRKQRGKAGFLFLGLDSRYFKTLMNWSVVTGFRVAADMQLMLPTEMQPEKAKGELLIVMVLFPSFKSLASINSQILTFVLTTVRLHLSSLRVLTALLQDFHRPMSFHHHAAQVAIQG